MKRVSPKEFHVAILGPLSGEREEEASLPRSIEIDAETFDAVLERFAPSVVLDGVGVDGGPHVHPIRRLDDFHPDALVEAVPALSALDALRQTVSDARTFSEVAAEIAAAKGEEPAPPKRESDDDTLARLLGRRSPRSAVEASARDAVDRLAREAVAPHVVASPDPRQAEWRKAVEAALTERLRAVLRQRGFRRLEGTWRAIHRLVLRVEVGGPVHLRLLPARGVGGVAARLESTLSSEGIDRFDLVVFTEAFGADDDGLAAIEGLASLAGALGTTVFASADPTLGSDLPDRAAARWEAIRRLPGARRVVLALPGVLARAPYGAKSDPIAAFAFEEAADRPGAGGFCFGPAALACAEAVVEAAGREEPEPLALAAVPIGDLPFGIFEAPDGRHIQPSAERLLPDRAVERLLDAGLTPLVAHAQRPDVRIVRLEPVGRP